MRKNGVQIIEFLNNLSTNWLFDERENIYQKA